MVWGFIGGLFGSLVGVALTMIMLFAAPPLHVDIPSPHAVVLLVVFGVPILIGVLLGLAFPGRVRALALGHLEWLRRVHGVNGRRGN